MYTVQQRERDGKATWRESRWHSEQGISYKSEKKQISVIFTTMQEGELAKK